jgi:hypothetical protein
MRNFMSRARTPVVFFPLCDNIHLMFTWISRPLWSVLITQSKLWFGTILTVF